MVQAYGNDPLNHNRISLRMFSQINGAGLWALDHAHQFSLPLLLMHGSADLITSPAASRQFASRVPGDCTFKLWEGLYHEIHNEPEQDQVIGFIIEWLRVRN